MRRELVLVFLWTSIQPSLSQRRLVHSWGPEAVDGAHAEYPAPVQEKDGCKGGLNLSICGDVALGEFVGAAVAAAGLEEGACFDA